MKNRHIIAAALLLLTTTAAAQDRHTETAPTPVKTANGTECRTAPPTDRNAATAARPARKGAGHPGRKETRAAFRSRGTHRQHERNHPLDTLQTINEAVKIVIYNDNSWKYVRDREFVKDSSIYTKYWDTGTLFPYKEYPLSEMPASLAIDLVDSLKCYHYPHKGSIRSKYGIRHRRRHQESIFRLKRAIPFMRLSTAGSASRSTTGAVTAT